MAYLLLHGLGADCRQPLNLLQPALPRGAQVLAPDLRAHGSSPLIGRPADFQFDALGMELSETVRSAGLADDPLVVIGISLGAALALQLARSRQFPIARLVLVRPAFTDEPIPPNLAVFPVIGELLHRYPADRAEALFRGTALYKSIREASPLGASGVIEQFRKPDAAGRAIRLVELPRNRALPGTETVVTAVGTTIIAAPRDPVHPLSVAALWNRRIPGSVLVELPARDDGMAAHVAATRSAVRSALQPSPPD